MADSRPTGFLGSSSSPITNCMIYCDAGSGFHLNCLQEAGRYLSRISYDLSWYIFLLRCRSFASRKVIHFPRNTLVFLAAIWSSFICKSQLEAIIKKPGNMWEDRTSFWLLIRRRTIPGFSFICNAGYGKGSWTKDPSVEVRVGGFHNLS